MLQAYMRRRLPPRFVWPTVANLLGLPGAKAVRVQPTPLGHELTVRLEPPLTAATVEAASARIAVAFGVTRCRVTPHPERADVVSVSLDRYSGLGPIPFPADRRPVWLPHDANEPVPLGVDDDGRFVAIPLVGSSMLVGGNPGAGKSSALRTLLAGMASHRDLALIGIDPKWAELGPWAPRMSALVLGNEPRPVLELLDALNVEVQRRSQHLAATGTAGWTPEPGLPAICVVVDEWAELAAGGTSKEHAEAGRMLRRFVAMGRAVGCGAVLATQRPTSDTIDTGTKALLAHRLALRCGDKYGSEAILGASQYEAASIPRSRPGRGLLSDGGSLRPVQVFDVAHAAISELTCPALRQDLGWLRTLSN